MDYNQPYGAATNAPYVNGNPATGVKGSVPPAGAMEYPQREIVSVIEAAGLTPSNSDLTQLLQAIRLIAPNIFIGLTDTGTANALVINLDPVPVTFSDGDLALIQKKAATPNTGAVTVDFNSLGAVALRDNGAVDFSSDALLGGALYLCAFRGGSWRVLGGTASFTNIGGTFNSGDGVEVTGTGVANRRRALGTHSTTHASTDKFSRGRGSDDADLWEDQAEFLAWLTSALPFPIVTAPPTLYVRTDGNDANNGLTNTAGGAFATISAAISAAVNRYVLAGRAVTIQLGIPGTYAAFHAQATPGTFIVLGDIANQSAYIISGGGLSSYSGVFQINGATLRFSGVTLHNSSNLTNTLASTSGGQIYLDNVSFANAVSSVYSIMDAFTGSTINFDGPIMINGVSGGTGPALMCQGGGIFGNNMTITFLGSPLFSYVAHCFNCGSMSLNNVVLSGSVLNGTTRYRAEMNGVINTFGSGENYFPGSAAGVKLTGGQYA